MQANNAIRMCVGVEKDSSPKPLYRKAARKDDIGLTQQNGNYQDFSAASFSLLSHHGYIRKRLRPVVFQ